uniref:G_PROTEIN_RECEP_F1_2 domain-containing protein n=1 Tax=Caenorhabditis tropicalis TaxID=1561998 RepID=A0A1I7UEB1_9PELO
MVTNECNPIGIVGHSLALVIFNEVTLTFDKIFRRLSAYLAVYMAFFRYLYLKTLLNPRFSSISKPLFGVKAVFLLFFVSISIDAFNHWGYSYVEVFTGFRPPDYCGYPENYTLTTIIYTKAVIISKQFDLSVYLFFIGISNLIPAVSLPILSFLLIGELRRAKDHLREFGPESKESPKPDHTTKMIIYMTIASIAAEGPIGICNIVSSFVDQFSMA